MKYFSNLVLILLTCCVNVCINTTSSSTVMNLGDCEFKKESLEQTGEESFLKVSLNDEAQLYASPGSKHTIGLSIEVIKSENILTDGLTSYPQCWFPWGQDQGKA